MQFKDYTGEIAERPKHLRALILPKYKCRSTYCPKILLYENCCAKTAQFCAALKEPDIRNFGHQYVVLSMSFDFRLPFVTR